MADLFISYSRRNKAFVQQLHVALADAERDVWVDWEDIPPTVEWWKEIERGIEAANVFVFIISTASLLSEICYREIEHAVSLNKRVIPLLLEDPKDPAVMDKMHPTISATNWIFFNDPQKFEDSFKTFIAAVDTDFEYVREHTRLLIRARDWERNRREPGYLLRGESLRDAEAWLTSGFDKDPKPLPLHSEYIINSQQAQSAFQRFRLIAVSVALVLTVFLAFAALAFGIEANRQTNIAQDALATSEYRLNENISLGLSGDSEDQLLTNNTELAILLAIAANNVPIEPPLPEAQLSLANAAYAPGARAEYRFDANVVAVVSVGNLVIAADDNQQITMRDMTTGAILAVFTTSSSITDMSTDGTVIAVGYEDGRVQIIDIASNAILAQWIAHTTPVNALDLRRNANGQLRLATVSDAGQVIVWNAETGMVLLNLTGHADTESVNAVTFGPGDATLVTGGDTNLIVWDLSIGVARASVNASIDATTTDGVAIFHSDRITAVTMSPAGDKVITGSADTTIKIWAFDGNTLSFDATLIGHEDTVTDLAYSNDGFTIVSGAGGFDASLIVWDAFAGTQLARLEEHSGAVNAIALVDGGLRVMSASNDDTVLMWDIENGALVSRLQGQTNDVSSVAFTPDGAFGVAANRDGSIFMWDLTTKAVVRTFNGHTDEVLAMAFSSDGSRLVSGDRSGITIIWDVETATPLATLLGHTQRILSVAYSPDGALVATGSRDDTIRIWNVEAAISAGSQTESALTLSLTGDANSIDFSPDGSRLLVGTRERDIELWDVFGGSLLDEFSPGGGSVTSVKFSPDGSLALVADSRDAKLIDINETDIGTTVRTLRGAHRSTVNSVAFSPDGGLAITAAADALLVIWDVETGQALVTLDGHRASANSVTFGPTGTFALSGGSDDVVLLWRIDSLDELLEWTFTNRLIDDDFSCAEREEFLLDPCDENNIFPTRTPFIAPTSDLGTPTPTPVQY